MKPKLILLTVLACGTLFSSVYWLVKSNNETVTCEKKCTNNKQPVIDKSAGTNDLHDPSFQRLIASTRK